MRPHLLKGNSAEQQARRHLERQGLKLLSTNYRCKRGEVDLIMWDRETLVFVEVRYRKSDRYGSAVETVTSLKQNRLIFAARQYLQENRTDAPCRFDVVGITGRNADQVEWIKNAFQTG
ncbi:MAG: YraN family protein [Gammaproteobacteria bacterium]|nr:YraN family protein [Gammaproteobacteria bacterium]